MKNNAVGSVDNKGILANDVSVLLKLLDYGIEGKSHQDTDFAQNALLINRKESDETHFIISKQLAEQFIDNGNLREYSPRGYVIVNTDDNKKSVMALCRDDEVVLRQLSRDGDGSEWEINDGTQVFEKAGEPQEDEQLNIGIQIDMSEDLTFSETGKKFPLRQIVDNSKE